MNESEYAKVAELFAAAIALPEEQRPAYLDRECQHDPELRVRVLDLLTADSDASFLDEPYHTELESDAQLDVNTICSIGSYRVERLIGRGSMGAVFAAQQENPAREVAVKLLTLGGPATTSFEAEAVALGRLQHAGIARVYEAGTAPVLCDDGTSLDAPFIAMERIHGVTLAEYVRENELSRQAVATLLLSLADALQHAHQRGVIHRDLKPSNILIDEAGNPHIIDFGVGLIRDHEDEDLGAAVAGTIAYMAPEQLIGRLEQIDTRVDIFSLGAIGHELLLGQPLHSSSRTLDDALFKRLTSRADDRHRQMARAAGRELARVILRATQPDPADRYQSAGELARDLRRVLSGRPVGGDEASAVRTVWLYFRRHRVASAALAVSVALLAFATAGMWMATQRAQRAAAESVQSLELARTERLHAERIAEFLKSSFLGVDPEELGSSASLFEAIDYAAGRIHRDLAEVPAVEADVRAAIGFVYRRHGRYADALEQVRIAHRLHRAIHGFSDSRSLDSAEELGYLTWLYQGDADAAIEELSAVLRAHQQAGPNASSAWIQIKIANIALALDRPNLAEQHLAEAEPLLVAEYGPVYAARTKRQMALVAMSRGNHDSAVSLARAALGLSESAAEQEYITARAKLTLGSALAVAGETDEAEAILGEAIADLQQLLGDQSLEAAQAYLRMAWLKILKDDYPSALRCAEQARAIRHGTLAPSHPELIEAQAVHAACAAMITDTDLDGLLSAHSAMERAYGPDHIESIRLLQVAHDAAKRLNDSHTERRLDETIQALLVRRSNRLGNAQG